jgi:hypothetical protein
MEKFQVAAIPAKAQEPTQQSAERAAADRMTALAAKIDQARLDRTQIAETAANTAATGKTMPATLQTFTCRSGTFRLAAD